MANNQMVGLAALMESRRSRARIAVSYGQSPLGAYIVENPTSSLTELASAFLTAYCAVPGQEAYGWISSRGFIIMADYIFRNTPEYRTLEEDMQLALIHGAITALWLTPSDYEYTDVQILAARQKLIQKIKTRPPTQSFARSALEIGFKLY